MDDILNFSDKNALGSKKAFSTIELFVGAGGLALGVKKAGFETIGLIEFDKSPSDTLKQNRPNWHVIHDDIAKTYMKNCWHMEGEEQESYAD